MTDTTDRQTTETYEIVYEISFEDAVRIGGYDLGDDNDRARARSWLESTGSCQGYDDDPFGNENLWLFVELPDGISEEQCETRYAFGQWIPFEAAESTGVPFRRTHAGDYVLADEADAEQFAAALAKDGQ